MQRPRGIVLALCCALLLAMGIGAGSYYCLWALPSPENADRDGLLRWLVTQDLAKEPPQTRTVLARRLEEEFGTGLDWNATANQLDDAKRQQLWQNIVVLLEPWFMAKVDGYRIVAESQRTAYLDRLIDMLDVWKGVDRLRPPETATTKKQQGGLMGLLLRQVESWKQRAEPQRRQEIDEFLVAVQWRWTTRSLQQLFPAITSGGG